MYEDLIRALRCTKNENADCRTCKYQVLYEGGYDYCDQERLEIDAAEAIKTLDSELADANESIRLAAEASKTIEANYKMQLANAAAERDEAIERTKRLCYLEYGGWCENDEEPCDGCVGRWRGR